MTLESGIRLGAYEILKPLGRGGMGEVYRARDTRLGREVALKTVLLTSEPEAISRFEQEARSASALNHPNIVTIYELGQADGTHYIAMELVPGETVRQLLITGPLPFRRAIAIGSQIADGLAKAHEIGVVHRDLKPENLMVQPDGTLKILDFGLAKLLDSANRFADEIATTTRPGMVMGTLGYMSPEQASGAPVDARSDQFSFASVLFEMVTGRPAFPGGSEAEVVAGILRDEPESIASRMMQVPAPFTWIIERCFAKDPSQRYSSTRDLARDLAAVRDRLADAPVRRPESRRVKLPVQRTTFIGREKETAALSQLLSRDDVWFVTLTGPGGIGKTRLALHVAGALVDRFPSGVCLSSLTAVTQGSEITAAIAQSLGITEIANQSPHEALNEYLSALHEPLLLILDNFEHLVASAGVVSDLLFTAPKLKILVTSQAPLHVYGEHEFPVPPLALPEGRARSSVNELLRLPAVALFVERAQAVKRDFVLNKENASTVAAICAALDGVPLAIELAAARIKLLSPTAMQARLESSLNLLTGGARDLPTRQQTLRGTVQWSYGLLNAAEQKLVRRLAVFASGCALDSIEAVCDTNGDLGIDVLDGMTSVVDKSLVQQVEQSTGDLRFVMLSTIRQYALEQLAASGEEGATRRAHAAYYLVLAEEDSQLPSSDADLFDQFQIEHHNFRAALDHLIKTGECDWGLRLGVALFRFWEAREHLSEGRDYITRLMKLPGAESCPKLLARLQFAAAVLAGEQGDYPAAQTLFAQSLNTCQQLQDDHGVAVALNAMGVNARDCGELGAATHYLEKSLEVWQRSGTKADIARCLSNLANVVKLQGDLVRAAALYEECLNNFRKAGEASGEVWTLNYLGDVVRAQNDYALALGYYERSLARFRELRDAWGVASVLSDLAALSCDQGNYTSAQRLYGESIRTFQNVGHRRGIARVLEKLAATAAAQGDPVRALRLAGAAAALRQTIGAPLRPLEQSTHEKALEVARQALTQAEGMACWLQGWGLTMEEAITDALSSQTGESAVSPA